MGSGPLGSKDSRLFLSHAEALEADESLAAITLADACVDDIWRVAPDEVAARNEQAQHQQQQLHKHFIKNEQW